MLAAPEVPCSGSGIGRATPGASSAMMRGELASELASECAAVFGGAIIRGVAARDVTAGAGMWASSVCDDVIRRAGMRSAGLCKQHRLPQC